MRVSTNPLLCSQVNFSAFNSTYEVDTPLCSSRDLERHYKERAKYKSKREKLMQEQQNMTLPAR